MYILNTSTDEYEQVGDSLEIPTSAWGGNSWENVYPVICFMTYNLGGDTTVSSGEFELISFDSLTDYYNQYCLVIFDIPEHGTLLWQRFNNTSGMPIGDPFTVSYEGYGFLWITQGEYICVYGVPDDGYVYNMTTVLHDETFTNYYISGQPVQINSNSTIYVFFSPTPAGTTGRTVVQMQSAIGGTTAIFYNGYWYNNTVTTNYTIPWHTAVYIQASPDSGYTFSMWIANYYGSNEIYDAFYTADNFRSTNSLEFISAFWANEQPDDMTIYCYFDYSGGVTPTSTPTTTTPLPTPYTAIVTLSIPMLAGIFATALISMICAYIAGKDGLLFGLMISFILFPLMGLYPPYMLILGIIFGAILVIDKGGFLRENPIGA